MNNSMKPIDLIATSPALNKPGRSKDTGSSWYEAMASAWGEALDTEATRIETMSNELTNGKDQPSDITKLSAEVMKMGFLSSSSHSAIQSVGDALSTMAKKS
jgi:hypothetical protein